MRRLPFVIVLGVVFIALLAWMVADRPLPTQAASIIDAGGDSRSGLAPIDAAPALPGATAICSNIVTDTVWTLGGSPYQICGTFAPSVVRGARLTIEPGVVVEFQSNAKLTI